MANQAEIAAMIDEKLKEHMNAINEQVTAAMSKMMSDLMAKQQQINVASQSEIPPPTRQGLRLDKSPTVNTNPTLQLDDAIVIDTSASPSVPVPHSPSNDENTKLLAKLDQREAANKAMIVTEAEHEQVKVPYHLPSTTPFIRLELWEDMSI
ncbi:hypothetical protein NL676_008541 [Syzygium grande]|nr:hypothetical protein NL676_008541 [Syzygium grande]